MIEQTYLESAKGVKITRNRAIVELQRHGICAFDDFADFFHYVKPDGHGNYSARLVLFWLGY